MRKNNLLKFDLQRFADDAPNTYLKDNLQGFVPKPTAAEIIADVVRGSSMLRLANVQPMESETKKFPVMVSGPGAYWVGETERIKTDVAKWIFPELVAKKIGVIVPVSKEKINDTTIDVFATVRPYIAEAFYKAIDAACLFGTNSPFEKNIFTVANTAGRKVEVGTNAKLDLDISDTMALVEDGGLDVNGFAAGYSLKNDLRKLRDANGNQLYVSGVDQETLYSQPIEFSRNGAWDKTKALAVAGDWKYAIVGVRDQIQYQVLQEATLQSVTMGDSKPLSLAENDMIAIKATMRLGFLPVKEEAFAVLTPKAGS